MELAYLTSLLGNTPHTVYPRKEGLLLHALSLKKGFPQSVAHRYHVETEEVVLPSTAQYTWLRRRLRKDIPIPAVIKSLGDIGGIGAECFTPLIARLISFSKRTRIVVYTTYPSEIRHNSGSSSLSRICKLSK